VGVVGSEVLLEQVQLNFSFRNNFTILLPCGRLVDNNKFSKTCVFISLTVYTDYGGYEKKFGIFNNNEFKGNEELMLLHDQNNGWAVPYPY
jgi:hypothetical protein